MFILFMISFAMQKFLLLKKSVSSAVSGSPGLVKKPPFHPLLLPHAYLPLISIALGWGQESRWAAASAQSFPVRIQVCPGLIPSALRATRQGLGWPEPPGRSLPAMQPHPFTPHKYFLFSKFACFRDNG